MARIKVRFNLGAGKNYMKWKVQDANGPQYFDPDEYVLHMAGCTLKNQRSTADKIFNGAHKTVCAWVLAERVTVLSRIDSVELPEDSAQLYYNPRVQPNWLAGDAVVDNHDYSVIWSNGKKLFGKK